jgi:glycosyltransferase involved in cell wall biosynthesis
MRILVISYIFPPYNASGSVRIGKLVAYLASRGHDVRVVAGDGLPLPADLEIAVPEAGVERAKHFNVAAPLDWARSLITGGESRHSTGNAGAPSQWMQGIANAYRALVAIPDPQVGWYPAAIRAAKRTLRNWTPDVIVSSALPFTSHLVAARVARECGRPWIADFRDLFADSPYIDQPQWRRWLDRHIERKILAGASACITVSPPLAEELAARHRKPSWVVTNGFDPLDIPASASPECAKGKDRPLRIVYTGIIYSGRRDPAPVFEAAALLRKQGKRIEFDFFGQDLRGVRASAEKYGIGDAVNISRPVSYHTALKLQCEADILLLLLWNDDRERGVYTGKLFEYIGARRPILATGCDDGVAASLIRERRLGVVANAPADIAAALASWCREREATGQIQAPPANAAAGLSRAEQLESFERFIRETVDRASVGAKSAA